jgi:hypothetical protein
VFLAPFAVSVRAVAFGACVDRVSDFVGRLHRPFPFRLLTSGLPLKPLEKESKFRSLPEGP